VKLAEDGERPVVIHAVQHLMHPPARLAAWPEGERNTLMVFIVRGIAQATISELFNALMGPPAADRPDRTALIDNPLVPFGGIDR
jgi:G3E family GTPase